MGMWTGSSSRDGSGQKIRQAAEERIRNSFMNGVRTDRLVWTREMDRGYGAGELTVKKKSGQTRTTDRKKLNRLQMENSMRQTNRHKKTDGVTWEAGDLN